MVLTIVPHTKYRTWYEDTDIIKKLLEYNEPVDDKTYREVMEFLYREAELLSFWMWREWLELFEDDVEYVMFLRVTREKGFGIGVIPYSPLLHETKASLKDRIKRLETEYAWSEDPPSRIRYFITNIRVCKGEKDEVIARSNVLYFRHRSDEPTYELLSYMRIDVLARRDGLWKIRRRYIIPDQTVLHVKNLSNFY